MNQLISKLAISEVFYSIQGEGITSGYPAVFVRLGGCNLMCGGMGTQFDKELHNNATWRCDTIEPLIQQNALKCFIEYIDLLYKNVYIEIETNGTIKPSDYLTKRIDQWNCSPKFENSGNEKVIFYQKDVIKKLNKLNTIFKFVVSEEKDWESIDKLYMPLIERIKNYLTNQNK